MTERASVPAAASAEPGSARALHARGLTFVFVAGVLYASAGLFTRALPFDAWTLLAWRSLSGSVFLVGLFAVQNRGFSARHYALTPVQWTLVPTVAAATICYIFALKVTTVANVMIVYATAPFVTALVAWIWVREVPTARMMVASSVALAGVAVMLVGGPASGGNLLGTALMLFMNLSFALSIVLARRDRDRSMTPVNAVALLLAAIVSFVMAPRTEAVGGGSLLLMVLFGFTTVGFAMWLFMAGARLAPSSEVALIGIADVVLGPLMVWLVFDEEPGVAALAGGALVAVALLWNIWPEVARLVSRHRR